LLKPGLLLDLHSHHYRLGSSHFIHDFLPIFHMCIPDRKHSYFTQQAENTNGFSEDLKIACKLIKKRLEIFGPRHQSF
jgi:hypothetical protein